MSFLYPDLSWTTPPLNPIIINTAAKKATQTTGCLRKEISPLQILPCSKTGVSAVSRGPTKGRLGLRWVHQRPVCRFLSSVGRSGREGRGVPKKTEEHFLTATPETCLPRIPRIKMLLRHHPPWSSSNTPGMSNHFSTAARRVSSMLPLQPSRTEPQQQPLSTGGFCTSRGVGPEAAGSPALPTEECTPVSVQGGRSGCQVSQCHPKSSLPTPTMAPAPLSKK